MGGKRKSAREKLEELEQQELFVFRKGWRGWPVWVWGIIGILAIWTASGLFVVALCLWTGVRGQDVGVVGDSFGAMNTLFSGGALLGVVVAIFMQRRELQMQRLELELTREELERTADAQEKVLEVQLEEQRARIQRDDRAAQPEFKFDGYYVTYFTEDDEEFEYPGSGNLANPDSVHRFSATVGFSMEQFAPNSFEVEGLNYWEAGEVRRPSPLEVKVSDAPYRLVLRSKSGEAAPPEDCSDARLRIKYLDAMDRRWQQTFRVNKKGEFIRVEEGPCPETAS